MANEVAIAVPDASKLEQDIENNLARARESLSDLAVKEVIEDLYKAEKALANVKKAKCETEADYKRLGQWLRSIREERSAQEARRKECTQPIHSVWKALNGFLGRPVKSLEEADRLANAKLNVFDQKREAERREREAKIRAIQDEEARRAKEAAEQAAKAAEEKGDQELAQEIRENVQLPIPAVIAPRVTPKVEGIRTSQTWKAEVVDLAQVPDEFIDRVPKMRVLDALAKDRKGSNPPPGVRFVPATTRSVVR